MNSAVIGIALVVAVVAVEIILAGKWHRGWFTAGLPVFVRRVERRGGLDDVPLDELARRSATAAAAPLAFHRFDANVIAFREPIVGQYLSIMRGVIRHDPSEPTVRVAGLINWWVIASVLVLVITMRSAAAIVAPYFLALIGILYFVQAVRYNRVASQLRQA